MDSLNEWSGNGQEIWQTNPEIRNHQNSSRFLRKEKHLSKDTVDFTHRNQDYNCLYRLCGLMKISIGLEFAEGQRGYPQTCTKSLTPNLSPYLQKHLDRQFCPSRETSMKRNWRNDARCSWWDIHLQTHDRDVLHSWRIRLTAPDISSSKLGHPQCETNLCSDLYNGVSHCLQR